MRLLRPFLKTHLRSLEPCPSCVTITLKIKSLSRIHQCSCLWLAFWNECLKLIYCGSLKLRSLLDFYLTVVSLHFRLPVFEVDSVHMWLLYWRTLLSITLIHSHLLPFFPLQTKYFSTFFLLSRESFIKYLISFEIQCYPNIHEYINQTI